MPKVYVVNSNNHRMEPDAEVFSSLMRATEYIEEHPYVVNARDEGEEFDRSMTPQMHAVGWRYYVCYDQGEGYAFWVVEKELDPCS